MTRMSFQASHPLRPITATQTSSPHQFDTDAYPAFGGRDEAPSPLFYALASLSSCNQVTAQLVAKDLGIALGHFSFRVQGDLDTAVLVGGAEGNANFDRVEVTATVESDATPEQQADIRVRAEQSPIVEKVFENVRMGQVKL